MPQPASNAAKAQALIDLFQQAQADLETELAAILDTPSKSAQAARIRRLIASTAATVDGMLTATADWLTATLPEIYGAGAAAAAEAVGSSFAWTMPHLEALQAYTEAVWSDVAKNLQSVTADTRQVLRAWAKDETRAALLESKTAVQAGKDMAKAAGEQGIFTVEYANGAKHTMANYAETVTRTTTATAYNKGAVQQCREDGIEQVQYLDGPDCGVDGHDDPVKADGMVVALDDVVEISHPNCVMPGQRVIPLDGVAEVRRAWFSGPRCKVTVQLGTGLDHLAVGPNHPVLTRRGWVPGDQLREGDHLIHDQWGYDAGKRGLKADLDQMPMVENLFETVRTVGSRSVVPATCDDLHGDGVFCQGEVDVVVPAGGLLFIGDPACVEHAGEGDLMGADEDVHLGLGSGVSRELFMRLDAATDGVVRCLDHVDPFSVGGGGPAVDHGLAAVAAEPVSLGDGPDGRLVAAHYRADLRASHALGVQGTDQFDAARLAVRRTEPVLVDVARLDFPGLPALLAGDGQALAASLTGTSGRTEPPLGVDRGSTDFARRHRFAFVEVVGLEVDHYEGWVFDMSTGAGFFTCSNLITRNCRRACAPVVDGAVADGADMTVGPSQAPEPPLIAAQPARQPRQPRKARTPRAAAS